MLESEADAVLLALHSSHAVWEVARRLEAASVVQRANGGYEVVVLFQQEDQHYGLRARELARFSDGQPCSPEELGGAEIPLVIDEPHGATPAVPGARVWFDDDEFDTSARPQDELPNTP